MAPARRSAQASAAAAPAAPSDPRTIGAGGRSTRSGTSVRVRLQRLDAELALPVYARRHDAGLDLRAAKRVTLLPGARALVPTGIAVAIPPGFAGFVLPRSGLALRHGVTVLNAPGLIDAGYRGEVQVLLVNHDPEEPISLERGERIAQLVIQRVARAVVAVVDALPGTERGTDGFGSTGN